MPEHEPLPKPEEYEAKPHTHDQELHRHDNMEQDIRGAVDAAGVDEVVGALAQVATGKADPEALLAWFEELREPEKQEGQNDALQQTGMVPDFIADTEFAFAMDVHEPAAEPPPPAPDQKATPTTDDDSAYMFSAVRRRRWDEEDDPDAPQDPPADDGGNKGKPKAKKR